MISLFAHNLHWMGEDRSLDSGDQCAHGNVEFRVNNTVFVKPEDGDWSLSAAGLYLLRTLEHSHAIGEADDPVTDNLLFPCCGFNVWIIEGRMAIMGCPNGVDLEVVRGEKDVTIRSREGTTEIVDAGEWKVAVLSFVDQIKKFYDSEAPKKAPEDKLDREGWEAFWKEWNTRRGDRI